MTPEEKKAQEVEIAKQVKEGIAHSDVALIQSIKGIGAKTAARVILDLKDKVLKVYDIEGKVVQSMMNFGATVGDNQLQLETKQLSRAIYILALEQDGNTLISKKLQVK